MTSFDDTTYSHALRILHYLKKTTSSGLLYTSSPKFYLYAYVDADGGTNSVDFKPFSGYIIYSSCGPLTWRTHKQKCVSTSTYEAEYVALSECIHELVSIYNLINELSLTVILPTIVYTDNNSVIASFTNGIVGKRSRHISLHCHYALDIVNQGTVVIRHIKTADQLADIFTKALPSSTFTRHYSSLMSTY